LKKILLLLILSLAFSQWSSDPASPQLLGSGVQAQVKATSDGGVYIAWITDMGGYHVYLQRFNSEGVPQFNDGGMLISDNNNASWIAVFHMNLDVDSENNAIITVLDERSGPWNVYAYKISPDGSMLWGDDGIVVSSSNNTNYSPRLAVFPDNSVVVTWSEDLSIVQFQRISAGGNLMWGDGIVIEDNNASLMSPQPIVSADGNALIQWVSQSGPIWAANSILYLQKYNVDGIPQWNEPTIAAGPVVFPMGNWLQQSVPEAMGGSFSAWTKMSGNVQSAVTQHITTDGDLSWIGGVSLSTNSSAFHMSPRLAVSENSQELMAVWNESNGSQSQRGVYAQRLDESGNRLWGMNGLPVIPLNNSFDYLDLSAVGIGEEMITVYLQQSVNMSGDVYAIRIDADGNPTWIDTAVEITNSGSSKSDVMVGKGQGCLFIAWTENGNVYAHSLREDGVLGTPDSFMLGDVNGDDDINVLDVVAIIGFIINPGEPSDSEFLAGDYNQDGELNVLDVVAIVYLIINPEEEEEEEEELPDECYLIPDPGPCFGYMPMYYYNLDLGQCEMFVYGGCAGLVPFESLAECQNTCE